MRSILSFIAGYVVLALALLTGFGLLGADGPGASAVLMFGAAALAGVATARVAPSRGRGHATLFGVVVSATAFAALFFGGPEAAETPLWARLAMALAPIPAASLGGRFGDRPAAPTG